MLHAYNYFSSTINRKLIIVPFSMFRGVKEHDNSIISSLELLLDS